MFYSLNLVQKCMRSSCALRCYKIKFCCFKILKRNIRVWLLEIQKAGGVSTRGIEKESKTPVQTTQGRLQLASFSDSNTDLTWRLLYQKLMFRMLSRLFKCWDFFCSRNLPPLMWRSYLPEWPSLLPHLVGIFQVPCILAALCLLHLFSHMLVTPSLCWSSASTIFKKIKHPLIVLLQEVSK